MSDDGRIRADLWVMAHVRRSLAAGIPATVARRGNPTGGMLVLKLNQMENGCKVLSQTRDVDGDICWLAAFKGEAVAEAEADDYIGRQVRRDPDLWVVEIEDRAGRHPFEGKVV